METVNNTQADYTERLEVDTALSEPPNELEGQHKDLAQKLGARMRELYVSEPSDRLMAYYRTTAQSEPECTRAWLESAGGEKYMPDMPSEEVRTVLVTEEVVLGEKGRIAVFENSRRRHIDLGPSGRGTVPGETTQQKIEVLEAAGKVVDLIEEAIAQTTDNESATA